MLLVVTALTSTFLLMAVRMAVCSARVYCLLNAVHFVSIAVQVSRNAKKLEMEGKAQRVATRRPKSD